MNPALAIFLGPLICGCQEKPAAPPKLMTVLSTSYDPRTNRTDITLPSTRVLHLHGRFEVRESFWTDTAAVWSGDHFSIWVLTGTVDTAQLVHQGPKWDVDHCPGPAFSRDGLRLYAWLDHGLGLSSIDVSSGTIAPLLRLPMHLVNYEGYQHYDPVPINDGPTVAEADPFLIALLQEESNEETRKDDVDSLRQGGHFISFADRRREGEAAPIHPTRQMMGKARSWAWSRLRKELYIVASHEGETTVGVYRLNGERIRTLDTRGGGRATRVVLSPDESTLIVERQEADQRGRGGLVTIDLSTDSVQEIARSGWGASWSPSGRAVFYLDEWRLLQLDRGTGETKLLASHDPPITEDVWPNARGPSVSSDGKRIAVNLGGFRNYLNGTRDIHTLFVDLEHSEAVIVDDLCKGVIWSPVPRPIGAK